MTAKTTFEGDDLRKVDPKFQPPRFAQHLAAVDELQTLAQERFGKSVLALAVLWVLDQGPTIALWGARHPGQLDPVGEIDGWHIDAQSKRDIDAILQRCIKDPVSPEFMAPPVKRPLKAAQPRLHRNKLATALANKLARIAWSVLRHNTAFDAHRVDIVAI
jgi:hypothetical protein